MVQTSPKDHPSLFQIILVCKIIVPQGRTSIWMLTNKCMNTDSIIELSKQTVLKGEEKIKVLQLGCIDFYFCSDVFGDELGRQHSLAISLHIFMMFSLPKPEQFQHLMSLRQTSE